jgi:hypothetical protein
MKESPEPVGSEDSDVLRHHIEEAVGFEPTVAINYDSFQDCSVRPLRHASVLTF